MPNITPTIAIRIRHPVYGAGTFHHLLTEPGQCRATFDGTDRFAAGQRRVLTRDLTAVPVEEPARDNVVRLPS